MDVFSFRRENRGQFDYSSVNALVEDSDSLMGWLHGASYKLTRRSWRFNSLFRKKKYELVHGHFGPGCLYALQYAEKFGLPLVCTFHGYDVPLLRHPRRWRPEFLRYALLYRRLFDRMNLGLCCSNDLRELLFELGVSEQKLKIYRLGIDLSKFYLRDFANKPVPEVMMIGRFVEKKGFEFGLRAFARVFKADQTGHLTIVGDGARRDRLEEIVKNENVEHAVTFTGAISSEEIVNRLQNTDVLLAPSVTAANGDRESGLIVAKEASACGVPVIGTYHGGIPEIIDDGKTGFLVQERDVKTMSERLQELFRNVTLRQQLGLSAREKMQKEYDLLERVRCLESFYDQARQDFVSS